MIGSLRGVVIERIAPSTVLVEVQGVGYLCTVTTSTFAELEPTVSTFLYVHHHIREDAQTIFGFLSRSERDTFHILVATHGIGPTMAMAILATYAPQSLVTIVASGDLGALTAVPGVGKKTAERLLVELKSRLDMDIVGPVGVEAVTSTMTDVREALAALGYLPEEIRDVSRQLTNFDDPGSMLRDALAMLGTHRAG